MTKILIAAYHHKHADYYAREILRIAPSSWKFIRDDWDIRGCRGMELLVVNAPRHIASYAEVEKRDYLLQACLAWGIDIKRVEIP